MNMNIPTANEELYHHLEKAYAHFNNRLYDNCLPGCIFVMERKAKCFGHYSHRRWSKNTETHADEICLNPSYFASFPLKELYQTLVHEMCHQWQCHFGTPSRSGYHNKEWAAKMDTIGLTPSSTGRPGGKRTGQNMADYAEPDGSFEKALLSLAQTELLAWFDRYPTEAPESVSTSPAQPLLAASMLDDESSESTNHDNAIDAALNQPISATFPTRPKTTKAKTKTTYICSSCAIKIWGKPNLNVICGVCNEPLRPHQLP